MNVKKYYFPPIGFGFWFQLGVLNSIKNNNYIIYGSSAGSIICLMNILKPEDRKLENILYICNKIRKKYKYNINLYHFINDFIKQIYIIIQYYDDTYISNKLKITNIEVSQIHTYCFIPYKISSVFIQPKNLLHLQKLIIASCFVPILTIYKYNPFFYTINNKIYIDGFVGSCSNHNNLIKINSYKYGTLVPKSNKYFKKLYYLGCNYKFVETNKHFSIITFLHITFNIFFDLSIYILYIIEYIYNKILLFM
jgi:hypothetical protein